MERVKIVNERKKKAWKSDIIGMKKGESGLVKMRVNKLVTSEPTTLIKLQSPTEACSARFGPTIWFV